MATAAHSSSCHDTLIHFRTDVPLIWIGGVPRSGTTLIRVALEAPEEEKKISSDVESVS